MDATQFRLAAIALLRSAVGWQSAIARRLAVNSRTVRRWIHNDATPPWADAKLAEMIGRAGPVQTWPRDEWMVGDGIDDDGHRPHRYVAHLRPPRFVARVVDVDDDGEPFAGEGPVDMVSGEIYTSLGSGFALLEIDWIDAIAPGDVSALLDAAADVVGPLA